MLAVATQALHQRRSFGKSAALHDVHPNPLGHRLAEAAETGLAQKTGATAQHIDGTQPIRKKREVGERRNSGACETSAEVGSRKWWLGQS